MTGGPEVYGLGIWKKAQDVFENTVQKFIKISVNAISVTLVWFLLYLACLAHLEIAFARREKQKSIK